MRYLLATNARMALINGKPNTVREKFARAAESGDTVATSTVAVLELWYGVAKKETTERKLSAFLAGPLGLLDFEEEDAHLASTIEAGLERADTPIGASDLLIAAQGLRLGATVITANSSEFSRVPSLSWEDWATGS